MRYHCRDTLHKLQFFSQNLTLSLEREKHSTHVCVSSYTAKHYLVGGMTQHFVPKINCFVKV